MKVTAGKSCNIRSFKADSHSMPCPCRSPAMPCRQGLECVFPIWFTQCGRVWFTLVMPSPCHAATMPFFSRPRHSTAIERRPCCGLEKNGMFGAWQGHGMASVNQTRSHCVNQMGKTHYKPLAARHGRGMAWARHGHSMLCVNPPLLCYRSAVICAAFCGISLAGLNLILWLPCIIHHEFD